ncbi:MAG: Nif3-like dinuclear metal center hexameric protein, partial [Saprospiraceae bacterium]|nr:Nif3-like dinuclear metal center hexameric protein [Saprospiraceae bacterium]
MTKVKDILQYLEGIAPFSLQESYDNSGLLVGSPSNEVTGTLISLD